MKSNGRAFEPLTIRYLNGKGSEQLKADAVIDSTGTWFSPSPAGADGLPAVGEKELHERDAYGMPDVLGRDRARYAGRTVAVLGAGHSAVENDASAMGFGRAMPAPMARITAIM